MWIPVLMVASMLFWTVALALGGMSLMAADRLSVFRSHDCPYQQQQEEDIVDRDSFSTRGGYDPIVVRIQESADPQDVGDNQGAGLTGAPSGTPSGATEDPPAGHRASEPGQTAF
jgi:hypothetical protein